MSEILTGLILDRILHFERWPGIAPTGQSEHLSWGESIAKFRTSS